jgi:hypothetical protein
MKSCTLIKKTLLAGATITVNATGSRIFVRKAVQPFKVVIDTGEQIELEDGFRYTAREDRMFSRLELTNPNSTDLVAEFYVGDSSVQRDAPTFTRDAPTTLTGDQYTLLGTGTGAGAGLATLPGVADGKHRKHLIITNDGPNHSVILYATEADQIADTNRIGKVYVNDSWVLSTSANVYLRNSDAAQTIEVYVAELFYV